MEINILTFVLLISILDASTSTTVTYVAQELSRVEREDSKSPKYVSNEDEKETTTFRFTDVDPCNASVNENDASRAQRSIQYSFSNATITESTTETVIDLSILSSEFLNCTHTNVEPGCYEKLSNGLVYVPLYNKLFNESNYIINDQKLLFICPQFFNHFVDKLTEKFSDETVIAVSIACTSISAICILLHITSFVCVKKLRNLPGYCLFSLCVALLAAYICTFAQEEGIAPLSCTVLGLLLLYFFLASLFWMNTMAYDVWKSIRMATAKFRRITDRPFKIQFARYSLYAWGTPLMIVLSSVIMHYTAPESSKYRLIFNESNCWFKYRSAGLLYFAAPLFTLIGMNVLLFASSFYMISSAAMSKSQSKSQSGSDLRFRLLLCLRLGSVMGFMWIFGILANFTKSEWMWYLYQVCSALQGVFIFCSFTVRERTRKMCMNTLRSRKISTMPTQTSSQHVTSV